MPGLLKALAALLVVLAAASFLALRVDPDLPPRWQPPRSTAVVEARPEVPFPTLLSVWEQPAPVARPVPISVPKPAPPALAPPAVDRASLKYLGTVRDAEGDRFLLKFLPTGQVLNLSEGQTAKGWTLLARDHQTLRLQGPGGLYEVVH